MYRCMSGGTTLSVDSDLRDRIRAQKVGGETYSDVLERLMREADSNDATQ